MSNGTDQPPPGRGPNIVSLAAELLRGGRVLPTAAQIAFTGEDAIVFFSYSNLDGSVSMQHRFLDAASGQIIPNNQTFPLGAFIQQTTIYPMGLGYLLGAYFQAHVLNDSLNGAPPFIQAYIARGTTIQNYTLQMLLAQGYTGVNVQVAFPNQAIQLASDTEGWRQWHTGTVPAPGGEVLETVPTLTEWRIQTIHLVLTTSATVAQRQVRLKIANTAAGPQFSYSAAVPPQPASTSWGYDFFIYANQQTTVIIDNVQAPLPAIRATPGVTFGTSTQGFQPDDQYTKVWYFTYEWRYVV